MNRMLIIYLMIRWFLFFSLCLAENPVDNWIEHHLDFLQADIKVVNFKISYYSGVNLKNENDISGEIFIGTNKQFRFVMGSRTIVSDGIVWKSYDARTDQLLIQKPENALEKALFSWVKRNTLKSMNVSLQSDGGYKIKLFSKENDVRVYFDFYSKKIDSIIIKHGGKSSVISNLKFYITDTLLLDIGSSTANIIDFR